VHEACRPAYEGFIDFNFVTFAADLAARSFVLHRKADTVQHEPGSFLRDT
jgi:hypothetical protein